MRRKNPPYSSYARHYDQIGQRQFGEASAIHLLALLRLRGYVPRSVLDLACGSGAATLAFALQGLSTTGLDISADMLNVARKSAERSNVQIDFVLGDMTDFIVDRRVDVCTSFYDSVNYLDDLNAINAFVECSFRALNDGGFLAFDINTRRKLEDHWGEATVIAADSDDLLMVYRSWFESAANSSPLIITGFERQPDGRWVRFDEEHIENAFAIADIKVSLQKAGFVAVEVIDWREASPGNFEPGSEDAYRVLFLAQKPVHEGTGG